MEVMEINTGERTKKKNLVEILDEQLCKLPEGGIVAINVEAKYTLTLEVVLLELFVNRKGFKGLYLCIDRPYTYMNDLLTAKKIDTEQVRFIDANTHLSIKKEDTEHVRFVKGPFDLTAIMHAINTESSRFEDTSKSFLLLDNIATLLLYNPADSVGKFVHMLTSKLRTTGITGLFIILENQMDKKLVDVIENFCDGRIDVLGEWIL